MTEKQLTYYKGRYKHPKWIHHNKKTGKYCVNRVIHNFKTYFGCYDTLYEAEKVVEFLNKHNWDINKLRRLSKIRS